MSTFRLISLAGKLLVLVVVYWLSRRKLGKGLKTNQGIQEITAAYRRGDYEAALAASEKLKDGAKDTSSSLFYRGSMLMQLGRLDESEKALLAGFKLEKDSRLIALRHVALGELRLEQGRYDEAAECFRKSNLVWPGRGEPDQCTADGLLRRGRQADQALQLARAAVEKERSRPPLSEETKKLNVAECLSTLAWAIAENTRDRDEVDRLVSEAVPMVEHAADSTGNASPRPTIARVQYYCGKAYLALDDQSKAMQHLDEAIRLDPKGMWGRHARQVHA